MRCETTRLAVRRIGLTAEKFAQYIRSSLVWPDRFFRFSFSATTKKNGKKRPGHARLILKQHFHLSDGKRGTSGVIHAAYADKIIYDVSNVLKNPNKFFVTS